MRSYNSFKAGLIVLGLSLFGCNDGYVGICGKVVEEQRARFKEICERNGLTPNLITKSLVADIKAKPKNRVKELALGADILQMRSQENFNNTFIAIQISKEVAEKHDITSNSSDSSEGQTQI